jgi:serine/threonine protein kinase/formylglycine-generating enzyme required for sulfatase activity
MSAPEVKKCKVCGGIYDLSLSYCLNDGTPLVLAGSLIGTMLDGRYRIDSLLGQGGMGVVYRATHVHIDTEFAIKVLHPDLVANQSAIERFRREAKAAGRIHHPNAVQVTDFGVAGGIVYLVMELVDGQSLRELLFREKTFDYIHAVSLMHQVCAAVEAAHQSGVIHRDLKPDNILIKRVGDIERVKVLDFGIAKLKEQTASSGSREALTREGAVIGTPEYMSPEQCRGRNLDSRSDIYSLGTILYEMLCGAPPFKGDSPAEVVAKHLTETTRPLCQVCATVPEPIERVVMRALEKDPAKRPPSATRFSQELLEAVKAVKSGYTTSVPASPSALERLGDETALARGGLLAEEPDPSSKDATTMIDPSMAAGQIAGAVSAGVGTRLISDQDLAPAPKSGDHISENLRPSGDQAIPVTPPSLPAIDAGAGIAGKLIKSPLLLAALALTLIAVMGVVAYKVWFAEPAQEAETSAPKQEEKVIPEITKGMVLIPGGKFMMGRAEGGFDDERPVREVEIKPFYMDKFEVTNQEYKAFLDATGQAAPKNWENNNYAPDAALLPVTYVTWQDAADYAKWAGKRLPTEAEWEYVARGGDRGYLYPWGNEWKEDFAYVNHPNRRRPAPIHSYEKDRSPFGGVYDLAGNVSEWVQDFYSDFYGGPPRAVKVYRGGNFADKPKTNTHRFADYLNPPRDDPEELRKYNTQTLPKVGFRCAKDANN